MIILIILGLLLALVGLAGCILPLIPGPPLSFLALLILSYAKDWQAFSLTFLIIVAGLTMVVTILDYVVPAAGAKRYGASKLGVGGSIIGMLGGLFFSRPGECSGVQLQGHWLGNWQREAGETGTPCRLGCPRWEHGSHWIKTGLFWIHAALIPQSGLLTIPGTSCCNSHTYILQEIHRSSGG